jgi:hypothetical protein
MLWLIYPLNSLDRELIVSQSHHLNSTEVTQVQGAKSDVCSNVVVLVFTGQEVGFSPGASPQFCKVTHVGHWPGSHPKCFPITTTVTINMTIIHPTISSVTTTIIT